MKSLLLLLLIFSVTFTGCASYQAHSLAALDPQYVKLYPELEDMEIGCKKYTRQDCETYFDRDLLKKGIQPIQLTFHNRSRHAYLFSLKDTSLPYVDPHKVEKSVRTSTFGRVAVYSSLGGALSLVGGHIFLLPLLPAIVDGMKSFYANQKLEKDFSKKTQEEIWILPGAFIKMVVFVKKEKVQCFDLTLVQEDTKKQIGVAICPF